MHVLLFFILLFGLVAAKKVRYDGYQVYEVTPQTLQHVDVLVKLTELVELDFWLRPSSIGHPCQVMVPPDLVQSILKHVTLAGMKYTLIRENVQDQLDEEEMRLSEKPELHVYNYSDYNPFEEYYPEMDQLVVACPSGFTCETYSIGTSYEGNDMRVFSITNGVLKPGMWLDAQMHAREWITGTTIMKIMDRLIRQYGSDTESTRLMDDFNWYFLPIVNPDGYIYTWTDDRYWRKSRSPNAGSSCIGTDMNRNWDDHFGGTGSSPDPCDDAYHGEYPESEIEVANMANEIRRLGVRIHALVTIHSWSNVWLHPYGWGCDPSPDHAEMNRVVQVTANATQETHNTSWGRGSLCTQMYAASGVTIDWAYNAAGILYSYTPELRGPGHDPPASEIEPSYEEIWNGLVAMCGEI